MLDTISKNKIGNMRSCEVLAALTVRAEYIAGVLLFDAAVH